ncbi:hypothetical protein [Synechococcus sp. PCC 7336]|uniref:hypothetical protein n=1 Tax=Synechococcus sp. PCC 7336 TaxID=195250 RepID=UPI00034C0DD5|nr:hypothetical protein [Synechococcus sp. PCC 7336]
MSEDRSDFFTGLLAGAVLGGVVGGVLGTVLTQQLSRDDKQRPSRKRAKTNGSRSDGKLLANRESQEFLAEVRQDADRAIAEARQSLDDKIAQLNAAIEDTRASLSIDSPVSTAASAPPDSADMQDVREAD